MFCMECGTSINANAKFCQKCGTGVDLEGIAEIKDSINVNYDGVTASQKDTPKANHPDFSQPEETTDSWTFGQILKCILLPKPKGSPRAGKKEIALRIAIGLFFGIIVYQLNFAGKALPKCDQSDTKKTIEKIINDLPLTKATNTRYVAIKNVTEQGFNSEADIRTCSATLVTTFGEDNLQYSIKKPKKNSRLFYVDLQVVQ